MQQRARSWGVLACCVVALAVLAIAQDVKIEDKSSAAAAEEPKCYKPNPDIPFMINKPNNWCELGKAVVPGRPGPA